ILTFQNHTNRPLTDFGGKTSIFSHPVYLFLREFSLQDFRGGSSPYFIKVTGRWNYINTESTETPYRGINKRGNQQHRQPDKTVSYYLITPKR
ncbi:hypothetical protein, partial [Escherichia coli]|uniref:hypothetical protein n=1 Tax=Escherichia coli TaxID=562 RepID=UPI000D4DCC10